MSMPRTCSGSRNLIGQIGMSLVELTLVLAIAAILLTIAAPAFTAILDSYRLSSATSALHAHLYQARSEAIKRNQRVRVSFATSDGGASWCFGMGSDIACDCTEASSCVLGGKERTVSSAAYPGVLIDPHISSPGDHFTFESVRWIMANTYGHVRFASAAGKQTRVIVSRMGRMRTCSPEGDAHVTGYTDTC